MLNSPEVIARLREARKKKGLIQEKLSELAGLSRNIVANIETDRTRLTRQEAIKLSKVLEIEDTYLLPHNEEPEQNHKKNVTKNVDRDIIYSLRLHKNEYVPYLDTTNMEAAIVVRSKEEVKSPTGFIYTPEFSDCIAYRIWDDAMAPIIHPGSIIFVRPVSNRHLLKFGRIFYLFIDSEPYLRLLEESKEDAELFILRPAKPNYRAITVKRSEVQYIAEVKGQQTGIFL